MEKSNYIDKVFLKREDVLFFKLAVMELKPSTEFEKEMKDLGVKKLDCLLCRIGNNGRKI